MSTPEHGITPVLTPEEPWLGLLSYRPEHQKFFFGRDQETEQLLRMIRREELTVVFGPSGTGKTSLLNAGVFPKLEKESFLPIYVRIDHNPGSPPADRQIRARIDAVIRAHGIDEASLLEAASQPPSSPEQEPVWEYLHRVEFWNKQNYPVTPVLFFDQFEEAFTLGGGRPETKRFFTELADLVENYTPVSVREYLTRTAGSLPYPPARRYKVVLSLREDFVHALDRLRTEMPTIMQNRFALTRMNGSQGMEVVLGPGGDIVTEDVATQIIRFVSSGQSAEDDGNSGTASELAKLEVEPALLSVVCRELNLRRLKQGAPRITQEQVRDSSGDILKDFYERSFDDIPAAARCFVEDRLLTGSGFRSTAPEEDAIKLGISPEVLSKLEDRRIIRRERRLRITHLELTHDLLCTVVQESRLQRQQQAQVKEEQEEGERLREKERSRLMRKAVVGLSMVLVLMLGLLGFAIWQWRRATTAQREALAKGKEAVEAAKKENEAKRQVEDLKKQLEAAVNNGNAKLTQKKFDEAVQEYNEAIKLDPDNPKSYNAMGYALMRAERYPEAIAILKKLTSQVAPKYIWGHYTLALVYWKDNQPDLALAEAKTVIGIDPAFCSTFKGDSNYDWFIRDPAYPKLCPGKVTSDSQ
jgi:TolA-binding protein